MFCFSELFRNNFLCHLREKLALGLDWNALFSRFHQVVPPSLVLLSPDVTHLSKGRENCRERAIHKVLWDAGDLFPPQREIILSSHLGSIRQ